MNNNDLLPSKADLRRLQGGFWRAINPFRSVASRINAATVDNPILRRRAIYAVRKYQIETNSLADTCISFTASAGFLFCSSLFFINDVKIIETVLILFLFSVLLSGSVAIHLGVKRENKLSKYDMPMLRGHGAHTGWPELDMVMSVDPFEAEACLLQGGMLTDDIQKLASLSVAMVNVKNRGTNLAHGMLQATTSLEISPSARTLVSRAVDIVKQEGTTRDAGLLTHGSVIDTLGYAGIRLDGSTDKAVT